MVHINFVNRIDELLIEQGSGAFITGNAGSLHQF